MEFTAEKADYNVAEFYDNFAKSLPKIVLVNQGFYGEISADTFDRGQVLRFHTVSQQSRIIAKAEHNKQTKFFSIPLTYQYNFCVVKHGRAGKEQSLSQIIRDHTLPTHVQFPKNKSINVGSHTINTNQLPTMELTRAFNEIYILGNFIIDGVLAHEIVHVPLYLSQLRFSLITGIEGQSREKWKSYQSELNRATLILEFNREFGNPDIAEYHQGRLEKVAIDADLEYAKIEPNVYTNFHTIFRVGLEARGLMPTFEPEENDPNVYEVISNPSENPVQMTSFKTALESAISAPNTAPPTAPKPAKPAKPTTPLSAPAKESRSNPPVVPKRDVRNSPKVQTKLQAPKEEKVYVNTISHVSPVVKPKTEKPSVQALPKARSDPKVQATPPQNVVQQAPVVAPPSSTEKTNIAVDSLSIGEVAEHMKALKLDKYIDVFKENLIDGKLLKELDKEVLKTDFNMSAVEAIRLKMFIDEGHIPS